MKESELFKQIADKQMPDLEKIRENILNSEGQEKKARILRFKPSRLIAVASVAALAVIGTVAAVASGGNGFLFFNPKPAVVATADEEAPKKETPVKPKPKKAKKQKSRTEKLTTEEKSLQKLSEQGFELDWIETVGRLGGCKLVYGSNSKTLDYDCEYIIGDYTFKTSTELSPYGLGLYVISGDRARTLSDAFTDKLVDMNDVISLIESKKDEIDFDFTYSINEYFEDWIRERLQRRVSTMAKLGRVDGFELYYNLRSNIKGSFEEAFGEYTLYTSKPKRDYPLGLYVRNGDNCSTLTEAFENGVITDMEKITELIKKNPKTKGIFKITAPEVIETETEPQTETVTDAQTETDAVIGEADETEPKTDEN